MSSRWGAELVCARCGERYRTMRTGLNFASARAELWNASDDPVDWRQKRRSGVLGYWHERKLALWREHLAWCESTTGEQHG